MLDLEDADSTFCPVYMGTCASSSTNPLAHPSCKIALPPVSHFLLPARPQPVQAFSDMVILLLQDRRLPPPSCFPAHMAPPGSGQRPRRQDLNSKNAFPEKAVNTRDRYYCFILTNDNRKYWGNTTLRKHFLLIAHFKRKTDNHTSIILSETTYPAWSRLLYSLDLISLAGLVSVTEANFFIGEK